MTCLFLNHQDVNCVYSCNKCLLGDYYLPRTILATGETAVNSRDEAPRGTHSGGEGGMHNMISKLGPAYDLSEK